MMGGKVYDEARGSTIHDVIDNHFSNLSTRDKLAFIQGVEYRKLYDIESRKTVLSTIRYLEASLSELLSSGRSRGEEYEYVRSLFDRYNDYLKGMDTRRGDYMPHQYPSEVYKVLWENKYYDSVVHSLEIERSKNKRLGASGDQEIATMSDAQIAEKAENIVESGWKKLSVGQQGSTFIPNFQQRTLFDPDIPYNTQTDVHQDYIYGVTRGIEKDLLVADYYAYLNKARNAGENKRVINATRDWYASQVTNKMLQSKKIPIERLKRGMEVTFLVKRQEVDPDMGLVNAEIRVGGTIDKIDKNSVRLLVDVPTARFQVGERLNKSKKIHDSIIKSGIDGMMTDKQMKVIDDLSFQGYMDPLTPERKKSLTVKEASGIIINALQSAYDDPSKLGTYNLSDVYTKDLQGNIVSNQLDRFIHKGSVEYFKGRARELDNVKGTDNGFSNKMDEVQYIFNKGLGTGLGWLSKAYRKTMGQLILAGINAPKAMMKNGLGYVIGNYSHAFIRSMIGRYNPESGSMEKDYMNLARAMKDFSAIKHGVTSRMTPEEQVVYNTLVGLNIADPSDLMNIVMGSLNVQPGETLGRGSTLSKLRYTAKVWKDASGYENYINKLTEFQTELRGATPEQKVKIRSKIATLKAQWRALVEGILKEGQNYTKEELAAAYDKIKDLSPTDMKINLAERENITRGLAAKMFMRSLGQSLTQSPWFLGLKLQTIPERLRPSTFFIGYNMATDLGFSPKEALQYGINYVEAWNANYDTPYRQFGNNTEIGKSLFQFAHYSVNGVTKGLRLWRDAFIQQLGKDYKDKSFIDKVKLTFGKEIQTYDEIQKAINQQGYVAKKDINLLRLALTRTLTGMVMMQLGATGTIKGLQYLQDPLIQLMYGTWDLIVGLATDTLPKGWDDTRQFMMDELNNLAWTIGAGYRSAINIATAPDEDIVKTLTTGRIAAQWGAVERAKNTLSVMQDKPVSRKVSNKTFFKPEYFVDQFLLGTQLFGTTVHSQFDQPYYNPGAIFKNDQFGTYQKYNRPMGINSREFLSWDKRMGRILFDPFRVLFPAGDRIVKPK